MQGITVEQERSEFLSKFTHFSLTLAGARDSHARIQLDRLSAMRAELARVKAKAQAGEALTAGETAYLTRHAA